MQWELFARTFSDVILLSICILPVALRNVWVSCPWHSGFCICKSGKVTLFGLVKFLECNEKEKLTSQYSLAYSFLIFIIHNNSYYVDLFVPAWFIAPGNTSALRKAALSSNDSGFYLMIQEVSDCLMCTYCVSGLCGKLPRLLLSGNTFLLLVLDFSEDQQLTFSVTIRLKCQRFVFPSFNFFNWVIP